MLADRGPPGAPKIGQANLALAQDARREWKTTSGASVKLMPRVQAGMSRDETECTQSVVLLITYACVPR